MPTTPLPQLTRDQITQVFKDPALVRAYDALQRALQYTPQDVDAINASIEALQTAVESLKDVGYVTLGHDPILSNERALAVGSNMTMVDGGPGGSLLIDSAPGLSPVADKTILANISGGAALPMPTALSAIFDSILGNTQGQLITRNAGGWTVLGPSTGGKILTENGAGANLSWTTPSGGTGPAFRVHVIGGTSITARDTPIKVLNLATDFDTASGWNSTTLRWTPPVAGIYSVKAGISTGSGTVGYLVSQIFKNGVNVNNGSTVNVASATLFVSNGHIDIAMNGTTDYLELYFQCGTTSGSTDNDAKTCFLSATWQCP